MKFLARVFFHTSLCPAFLLSFSVPLCQTSHAFSLRFVDRFVMWLQNFPFPIEFSARGPVSFQYRGVKKKKKERTSGGKLIRVFASSRIDFKRGPELCSNNSINFSLFDNLSPYRPSRHFHIWLNYFTSVFCGTHRSPSALNFDWNSLNSFIVHHHL